MPRVEVHHVVGQGLDQAIRRLLDAAELATGHPALSDHLALDLARGGGHGFVAVTAADDAGRLVGYAQASPANRAYALELVIDPARSDRTATIGGAVLEAAIAAIGGEGGGLVNWMVHGPGPAHDELARRHGMTISRTINQMRRSLPTGMDVTIDTRPFVVGEDDEAWLTVNNRAFDGHGEQGGWTIETLRRRQREDWFDAGDVLLHERDGRLAAFCWTKVHPATHAEPAIGEIYVIAVDPDYHGQGLGRQMTLAGLAHLARQGISIGMLWVDAGNRAAVSLYTRLGFAISATTVAFSTDVPATATANDEGANR